MSTNILTIGIPTYNRVAGVTQHARKLIEESVHDAVRVLIIDNASTDGTFEALRDICDGTGIRVLRNESNLGYRGNFLRLFQACETEYLLVTSDEDPVIPAHLGALVQFLQTHRPLFVSPQYYTYVGGGTPYLFRGQLATRRIRPQDFYSCSIHMPGLVFRTSESKEVLSDIRSHIEKDELAVFPQVLQAAGLILRGPCFWWNRPIVHREYVFPQLHGAFNVTRCWGYHKGLVDYFRDRVEKAENPATKQTAAKMLQALEDTMTFYVLRF